LARGNEAAVDIETLVATIVQIAVVNDFSGHFEVVAGFILRGM
jgi:hypothetical protein